MFSFMAFGFAMILNQLIASKLFHIDFRKLFQHCVYFKDIYVTLSAKISLILGVKMLIFAEKVTYIYNQMRRFFYRWVIYGQVYNME